MDERWKSKSKVKSTHSFLGFRKGLPSLTSTGGNIKDHVFGSQRPIGGRCNGLLIVCQKAVIERRGGDVRRMMKGKKKWIERTGGIQRVSWYRWTGNGVRSSAGPSLSEPYWSGWSTDRRRSRNTLEDAFYTRLVQYETPPNRAV